MVETVQKKIEELIERASLIKQHIKKKEDKSES